jgi:hypothetical protein
MKKATLTFMVLTACSLFIVACAKSDKDDDNNNNNNKIPDAVFSMSVSGTESHSFSFTLDKGTATDHAINGSHLSSQQLLSVGAMTMPPTWMYNLVADVNTLATGTYNIKVQTSAFSNPSQTNAYLAVSGTVTITKAELYQGVSSIKDYYIDGTFSGTYEDTNTPPNQITVTGSFSGVNIKAN